MASPLVAAVTFKNKGVEMTSLEVTASPIIGSLKGRLNLSFDDLASIPPNMGSNQMDRSL